MDPNYFPVGYTGYCPDARHRIGKSYGKVTRELCREYPNVRNRLSAMHYIPIPQKLANRYTRDPPQKDGYSPEYGIEYECEGAECICDIMRSICPYHKGSALEYSPCALRRQPEQTDTCRIQIRPCDCHYPERKKPLTPTKYQRTEKYMPVRRGGVAVNYTGHIPGFQSSYGEPFGTLSRRLLMEHFRHQDYGI